MTAAVTHLAFYPPIKTTPRETSQWRKPKVEKTNRSAGCMPSTGREGRNSNTGANTKGAVHEPDTILLSEYGCNREKDESRTSDNE